jgi:2-polyprenyl-3-methyl-5-hydroxy-6-metoxy-1,4-benzoquinol methylase
MKKFESTVYHLKNGCLKDRYISGDSYAFNKAQTLTFSSLINRPYDSVLDVGCGHGYFSYVGAVEKKFTHCLGVDIVNKFEIKELKQLNKNITFKLITGDILPCTDNSFDLVFSMDVVEHIDNDMEFIKEQFRVCRKGGTILIGTPNLNRPANYFLKAFGKLQFPMGINDCIHVREYTMNKLSSKIIQASDNKLSKYDIRFTPCWFGIIPLNVGFDPVPKILTPFCHYLFMTFKKTW